MNNDPHVKSPLPAQAGGGPVTPSALESALEQLRNYESERWVTLRESEAAALLAKIEAADRLDLRQQSGVCPNCDGTKKLHGTNPCRACNGTGQQPAQPESDTHIKCIEVGNWYSEYQCTQCGAKWVQDDDAPHHEHHCEAPSDLTAAQQRIADLESELENERARGIHTCHDQCQRPLCVAMRRIAHIVAVVNPHIADLARVAAIFREHGMHNSADETEKAISELRTALKDPT